MQNVMSGLLESGFDRNYTNYNYNSTIQITIRERYKSHMSVEIIRGRRLNKYLEDYVVFDLETTGISVVSDEIVEISAVKVSRHEIEDTFSTLVNPGMPIPRSATQVNGITDDMVSSAPDLGTALAQAMEFFGDRVLVGHNIHTFDMKFLSRAALGLYGTEIANDYVDTLYIARACLPKLKHHRLVDVSEHFQISTIGAHRALNDCMMNQKCYEQLGKLMGQEKDSCCPKCGSLLIRRNGRYGEFYGCSGFPECRYTKKVSS